MLMRYPKSGFSGSKLASHPFHQTCQLASKRSIDLTPFCVSRAGNTCVSSRRENNIASRWMSSWPRPSKHQATPRPLYLRPDGPSIPFCRSCGRMISMSRSAQAKIMLQRLMIQPGARRSDSKDDAPVAYCSRKCRSRKPGALDRRIEEAFVALLSGDEWTAQQKDGVEEEGRRRRTQASRSQSESRLGSSRVLVSCAEVEALIFGNPQSLTDESDQQHDRTSSTDPGMNERRLVDTESRNTSTKLADQDEVATSIDGRDADDPIPRPLRTSERPAKDVSHLDERKNGEKKTAKTQTQVVNQQAGLQNAHRREMVRCAARRGVAFGFMVKSPAEGELRSRKRKCEAIVQGKVVEPSFAKGDWSVRWRERED